MEEPQATSAIVHFTVQYKRFEQQWDGFSWLLCRSPHLSTRIKLKHKNYRLMHRAGDKEFNLVGIAAVFTYTEDVVNLLDVKAWEEVS